ncbi:MAG: hypothetical protein WCL71_15450 [Deltaproteobacteria bacterium]
MAAEREYLVARYHGAIKESQNRGCESNTLVFTAKVEANSVAVINFWPELLASFLRDDNALYSNYELQTGAETRRAALMPNDRERRGTEGTLFGDYGSEIRYAALSLSLNSKGLVSYGSCAVVLRDKLCSNKASLLEENSYSFVRRHRLLPGDEVPCGHRAAWQDRHLLATAKLAVQIEEHTPPEAFADLVLYSDGNRRTDEFIEVHVFGAFGKEAFVATTIPNPAQSQNDELYRLNEIQERLARLAIPCTLI